MVVGPTGGGKSENIRVLGAALTKLKAKSVEGDHFEKTRIYHLNPKSITMGQVRFMHSSMDSMHKLI